MSGSDVEHVSGVVDARPPSRRLSSPGSPELYNALSNNDSHDPSLTLTPSRPNSSQSGTTYTPQQGVSGSQAVAIPATVGPNGHPNRHHRSSPDPDDYYRSHSPTLSLERDTANRPGSGSLSARSEQATDPRAVYTSHRVLSDPAHLAGLASVDRDQHRSVSDTYRQGRSDIPSGPYSVRPLAVRSKQTAFKDLVNKFNNNADQVLPVPSASSSASRDQSRASSPAPGDPSTQPGAASRRRDTGGSTTQNQQTPSWDPAADEVQGLPPRFAPPTTTTNRMNHNPADNHRPPNLLPRRRLFGELLTVDTDFQGHGIPSHLRRRGSEGSISSPNPAFSENRDLLSNHTPLTPTAWYLGRTPFLEAVSTSEDSNRHRRTRSDFPGNSPVGASTHPPYPHMAVSAPLPPASQVSRAHSKSRIPISSRRLSSPAAASDHSPPSSSPQSPVRGRVSTQTHLPPKGSSRLPKPSPRSPRDLVAHARPTLSTSSTPTPTRGRRETGYARSRTKVAEKSPQLEAYIAAPPPKKSPPLRSSRPRQPVSHNATPATKSSVGEKVSTLQRQIHRERETRPSRPRDRRLPELGTVDFATRRQKIQQAFNRTVKENEKREEEAAELRRRTQPKESRSKPLDTTPADLEQSEATPVDPEPAHPVDDTATVIDESTETCDEATPEKTDTESFPPLHVDTDVPNDDTHAMTMDSPTLGHPIPAREERESKPSDALPPASSATSCSEDSPVTTFDPEPQTEELQRKVSTSHRTLLNQIMRIRESSPSSSSCDEEEYGFSDPDDKGSIPILLRDKLAASGPQQPTDLQAQRNTAGDTSNRWSMSSWSSSLRNQQSTDEQCDECGDNISQLHQSTEDSELATQSCSASSTTPSDTGKNIPSVAAQPTQKEDEMRQGDATRPKGLGHTKAPSLAKLGGWDSKKITQLYLEELARGREHSLPFEIRASPEPRFSNHDLRSDGRTDSLTDDPVVISKIDEPPRSHRHSHSASLVLRDDWEHASPSIMDWMQVAADDGSAAQGRAANASPQNDSLPTPKLMTSDPQEAYSTEQAKSGLGLAINVHSPQETESQQPAVPSVQRPDTQAPPADAGVDTSVPRESLEHPQTNQSFQQPQITPETAPFAPLGPVKSTSSSQDSFGRHGTSPSPPARDSSVTSLVPSSMEQPRTEASSPTPEQRRLKKRRHVIKELVDTEYTFGRDMKVVDDIYKGTSSSCLDLSADDIRTLFANSDQIVQFSMTFLDALREAAKSVYVMPKSQRWGSKRSSRNPHASRNDPESNEGAGQSELETDRATTVGQAFLTHLAHMEKVYAEYLKNHDAANKKLQTLQHSENVSIWLNECREWASDLTTAWDLDSLIVKPVQRILKYPLLITELLDSTPTDHADHASLVKALEEVTNISVRINEMKRRADVVGQVVGRKRKESDVRIGLSKAFGRRTEKLRQQVGLSDMVADKDYDALAQRFGDNFFQLQVVMRDAEMYTRETQGSLERFLEFVTAIEAFIDVFQTSYPELEGKWRLFKISVQDIISATLPEHVSEFYDSESNR